VEQKLGWESIPIRRLSLSTKSTLRSSKAKYLMDNHLRIERKEKTQQPTDQPKRGKDGERKRKRGKDRSKRKNKNKNNTSTKDACKYCKKKKKIPSEAS